MQTYENQTGYIRSGRMAGFYVRIAFDSESGGYYVFYSKDFSQPAAEGYDDWYLEMKDVERLLAKLDIEWHDSE